MVKVFAMYKHPADAAAFDRYYYASHVPMAKRMPGLASYEVTRGPIFAMSGDSAPYYLIAMLTFASKSALDMAMASPEGQATAADVANFAMAGVDLMIAEAETI